MSLKLYGVPFSQPFRAVAWSLLIKKKKFEVKMVNPGGKGKNGTRHETFLKLNRAGTIPLLDDNGITISESNAILCYLANKFMWTDLYPSVQESEQRALVDWYLHYHHLSIRPMAGAEIVKIVRPDIVQKADVQERDVKSFENGLSVIDEGWLSNRRYLTGENWSLADIGKLSELIIKHIHEA